MKRNNIKLYDELYYEIFNLLTDWIKSNNVNYDFMRYKTIGFFPYFEKDDCNRIPANWSDMHWYLLRHLVDVKLEKRINEEGNPFPLAIFEDEKLSCIHYKIKDWYERHRLYPEFNKPEPNRKRCYRPTQYKYARRWLWRNIRKKLWKWKFDNKIEFHLTYVMV